MSSEQLFLDELHSSAANPHGRLSAQPTDYAIQWQRRFVGSGSMPRHPHLAYKLALVSRLPRLWPAPERPAATHRPRNTLSGLRLDRYDLLLRSSVGKGDRTRRGGASTGVWAVVNGLMPAVTVGQLPQPTRSSNTGASLLQHFFALTARVVWFNRWGRCAYVEQTDVRGHWIARFVANG